MKFVFRLNFMRLFLLSCVCIYGYRPPQLMNFGNSCYTNAALQVIFNMRDLNDLLLKNLALLSNNHDLFKYYVPLLKTFTDLPESTDTEAEKMRYDIFNTQLQAYYTFVGEKLKNLYGETIACGQQTAAEVCQMLLHSFNITSEVHTVSEIDFLTDEQQFYYLPFKQLVLWNEHSVIRDSKGKSSEKNSLFSVLQVKLYSVGQKQNSSLDDALQEFSQPELVSYTQPGFECPCTKQLTLTDEQAQYLCIELPRSRVEDGKLVRIDHIVDVPLGLRLKKPWFAGEFIERFAEYELIGVIIHGGGATYGHYTAYVKDQYSPIESWYYCNDSSIDVRGQVLSNDDQKIINKQATFVVYKQINTVQEPKDLPSVDDELTLFNQQLRALAAQLAKQ